MTTEHQELLIVKGVTAYIGDTTSFERGLTSISLLSENGQAGFSLNSANGWSPRRPTLKGGGVWSDSSVSPGRTLIAGEDSNVIEEMQLTLIGNTMIDLSARISTMEQMIEACRHFSDSFYQIDPVFLFWRVLGAKNSQYALIHYIDMAIEEPDVWSNPVRDVTLTIEREPYWAALPPGQNPKVYTFLSRGDDYTYLNLGLDTGSTGNQHMFNGNLANNDRSPNNNYIEIAASKIPGDAPALLQISGELDSAATQTKHWIAVKTEPFSWGANSFISTLDASAATLGTDAATAADATVASGNRVNVSFATVATDALRVTFGVTVPAYKGRFAAYLRAYQNAGAAGDIKAHLEVQADTGFFPFPVGLELPEVQFSVGATQYPMVYLGQIELPIGPRISVSGTNGIGTANYALQLYARRTTGVGTLRIADLVLMPLDEGHITVVSDYDSAKSSDLVYDNTRYFLHGQSGPYVSPHLRGGAGRILGTADWSGPELFLYPGRTNRIYFIVESANTTPAASAGTFVGNIIPRWKGIRDV